MLCRFEEDYFTKSPNVVIGNKSLRGNGVHEERFKVINYDTQVSSKTKHSGGTTNWIWESTKNRISNFTNSNYCRNLYKPSFDLVMPKTDTAYTQQ